MDDKFDEAVAKAKAAIDKHGFYVVGVGSSVTEPTFSYTVGLTTTFNHPEIIVSGLNPTLAHQIFWGMVDKIRAGHKFFEGVSEVVLKDYSVWFKPLRYQIVDEHFGFGIRILGGVPDAMQLCWPDKTNKWPWEAGFLGMQKLFAEG